MSVCLQEVYLRLMALTAMALLSSQQHTHQSKDPATTSKVAGQLSRPSKEDGLAG